MKIWNGYGSEHSMNLVMVGHFKSAVDADAAKELIDNLKERLDGKIRVGETGLRYSDEVMDVLRGLDFYNVSPLELEQLFYEHHLDIQEDKLILKTEENEISTFLRIMLEKGAKIEIYSAHDYPNEQHGRGK